MNTKIIVAMVIGIALVGLTGAASADPSINFPTGTYTDYQLISFYGMEELDDDSFYVDVESGVDYTMDVGIGGWLYPDDYVYKEGEVNNKVYSDHYGSGNVEGSVIQAGGVYDVLLSSDEVIGGMASYQEVSFEGESVTEDWFWFIPLTGTYFQTDGFTYTETPHIATELDNYGTGWTGADADGVFTKGTDTFTASSEYYTNILPEETNTITNYLDVSISRESTGFDQEVFVGGYLDAWMP